MTRFSFVSFQMKAVLCGVCVAGFSVMIPHTVAAQKNAAVNVREDLAAKPLDELVRLAWAAADQKEYEELDQIFYAGLQSYEPQAMSRHASLLNFPTRDRIAEFTDMNNVAVLHFVRAESLMHQGENAESAELFKELIKKYPYSQSWDPSRGSYWSIAEKAQESIDVMTGVTAIRDEALRSAPLTKPTLAKPGKDRVVDYTKYGKMTGVGTKDYAFQMGSPSLLSAATGEGIFPNTSDALLDPRYRELYREGRLNGTHWDFVNTRDREAAFYKWATAQDSPGVKLFYTGLIFERSAMYVEAIKAYHALIVHFPRSFGMTYWQTPWYPAQAAVAKIKNILRLHPELNLDYIGGHVQVQNGADKDMANDVFIITPGVISESSGLQTQKKRDAAVRLGNVKRRLGGKNTQFVQYANGHWRMIVKGKPFIIKGVTYAPTKVGQSPDKGTMENWMIQDADKNGLIDSPYEAWADKNHNNEKDADEPNVGDFQLMKEMGANTLRIYRNDYKVVNKKLLKDLYERFGIMVIMGDFIGKYALGSGADWAEGTDYENPVHKANMMKNIEDMILEFKDEPYILMWLLGNENNYGVASNGDKKPEAYFRFANEVAQKIKKLDPTRPVALCNGDVLFLDYFNKYAPDVDAFGANVYRGDYGFGSFWDEVKMNADKPAFITEYGAPAYSKFANAEEAEEEQAAYHRGSWLDIMANSVGRADGEGNAVGGVAFEWMDEWWKNYEPAKHDIKADVIGPFAGGYYFEEWFGLVGQGNGKNSPLMRHLRKVYFVYQDLWNEKKGR